MCVLRTALAGARVRRMVAEDRVPPISALAAARGRLVMVDPLPALAVRVGSHAPPVLPDSPALVGAARVFRPDQPACQDLPPAVRTSCAFVRSLGLEVAVQTRDASTARFRAARCR